MASIRGLTRPYTPAWRQWGRVTVAGVRLRHKRTPFYLHALAAWIIILVLLYVLRLFAKNSHAENMASMTTENKYDDKDTEFWTKRHLIFCISAGYAGSDRLTRVLGAARDTRAFHQPRPEMADDTLRAVLLEGRRSESFASRTAEKLGAIKRELARSSKDIVYAETSHMFIKTFADVILYTLGDIANISIIALHQPLHLVIFNQLNNHWFSSSPPDNRVWYYDVADVHKSERVFPANFSAESVVDRAIAYNTDVWLRGQRLKQSVKHMHKLGRWQHVHIVDIRVEDMMSSNAIFSIFRSLGLKVNHRRLNMLSEDVNDDNADKNDDSTDADSRAASDVVKRQGEQNRERQLLGNIFNRIEEVSAIIPVLNDLTGMST